MRYASICSLLLAAASVAPAVSAPTGTNTGAGTPEPTGTGTGTNNGPKVVTFATEANGPDELKRTSPPRGPSPYPKPKPSSWVSRAGNMITASLRPSRREDHGLSERSFVNGGLFRRSFEDEDLYLRSFDDEDLFGRGPDDAGELHTREDMDFWLQ